jgi:uncharacterized protein
MLLNTEATVRGLILATQSIAVVGLSERPDRASHQVAAYMQARGYRIIPINPNMDSVLGERCYPSLSAAAQDHALDMVNVFRRSEDTPPLAQEALASGARSLWLQLGIAHTQVQALCDAAQVPLVMDRCLKVDHARWVGA